MDQGTAKADLAQQALGEILEAVDHNVQRVTEIASSALAMKTPPARKVADAMHSMGAVVEKNTAATEEMAAQAAEVNDAIAAIASVSEEQSASTEQASASTEEMSAQMEEMSAQARRLAATAQQLKTMVDHFNIDQAAPRGRMWFHSAARHSKSP